MPQWLAIPVSRYPYYDTPCESVATDRCADETRQLNGVAATVFAEEECPEASDGDDAASQTPPNSQISDPVVGSRAVVRHDHGPRRSLRQKV